MNLFSKLKGGLSGFSMGYAAASQQKRLRNYIRSIPNLINDIKAAWRPTAGRIIDLLAHSGYIAGAIQKQADDIVGTGLRLNSTPNLHALGWNEKQGKEWADFCETEWKLYSNNPLLCDAGQRWTVSQLAALEIKDLFIYGEYFASFPLVKIGDAVYPKIALLSPSRMADKDGEGWKHGIKLGEYGEAMAYAFNVDAKFGTKQIILNALDADNRINILHKFTGTQSGQIRGISQLTPVLALARQFDQLANSTLDAAIIQANFVATLKSDAAPEEAYEGVINQDEWEDGTKPSSYDEQLQAKSEHYDNLDINMSKSGKINHLFSGDQLDFHTSKTPHEYYEPFSKGLLKEQAAAIGMSYGSFANDYRTATYSSLRVEVAKEFKTVTIRRKDFIEPFYQTSFENLIEYKIGMGAFTLPGGLDYFIANKKALCSIELTGSGQPIIDDFKSAKADDLTIRNGTNDLEQVHKSRGTDAGESISRRVRQRDLAAANGLPSVDIVEATTSPYEDEIEEEFEDEKEED